MGVKIVGLHFIRLENCCCRIYLFFLIVSGKASRYFEYINPQGVFYLNGMDS